MWRHSFTFNGADMRERFGLIVEDFQDVLMPALRPRKVVVPSRDGAWDYGATRRDERELTIACASPGLSRGQCRQLALALSVKGRIVRWDEPEVHYVGRLYDPAAIERLAGKAKRFELVFICDPFAYGRTVDTALLGRVDYAGTAPTPTRLMITNTGDAPITGVCVTIRRRGEEL